MVAIKYIEMPRTCSDCSLCQFDYWEGNICSKTQEKVNSSYTTERGSYCPLIEIEERKVGKWIKNSNCISTVREPFYYQCSICECPARSNNHKFCPNCGAEMRGSENEVD